MVTKYTTFINVDQSISVVADIIYLAPYTGCYS